MSTENANFHTAIEKLRTDDKGAHAEATRMLEVLLGRQVKDESSKFVGQFPWAAGRSVDDLNVALFRLPLLLEVLERHANKLPEASVARLEKAAQRSLLAVQRRWDEEIFDIHRDHKAYTNIFLLYIQGLLLAGRHYGNARLTRCAKAQWQRWFNHVAYYGIDEFVGHYFDSVDFDALQDIGEAAASDRMRVEAQRMLDQVSLIQHAVTHPRMKLVVCGYSRNKREFIQGGPAEGRSILAGNTGNVRNKFAPPGVADEYRPPSAIVEAYRNRRFPYRAQGRATAVPFLYKSWQDERAAMGSMSGGNYFWQQIHCMAAVGDGPQSREIAFMPGSYSIANGYVRQRDNRALCLFSRRPNTYLRTQLFPTEKEMKEAFNTFGIGLTSGWKITRDDSSLVLEAFDYRLTIDAFVIENGTIVFKELTQTHRASASHGGLRRMPANMNEMCFPEGFEWWGCLVRLAPADEPRPAAADVTLRTEGRRMDLSESGGLRLSLHLQSAGGETELYDKDWRTMPLFECPERTIWPGEAAIPR